jgi:hypothetical protein
LPTVSSGQGVSRSSFDEVGAKLEPHTPVMDQFTRLRKSQGDD